MADEVALAEADLSHAQAHGAPAVVPLHWRLLWMGGLDTPSTPWMGDDRLHPPAVSSLWGLTNQQTGLRAARR